MQYSVFWNKKVLKKDSLSVGESFRVRGEGKNEIGRVSAFAEKEKMRLEEFPRSRRRKKYDWKSFRARGEIKNAIGRVSALAEKKKMRLEKLPRLRRRKKCNWKSFRARGDIIRAFGKAFAFAEEGATAFKKDLSIIPFQFGTRQTFTQKESIILLFFEQGKLIFKYFLCLYVGFSKKIRQWFPTCWRRSYSESRESLLSRLTQLGELCIFT